MQRSRAGWRLLFLFVFAPLFFPSHSRALPPDPAARGLDVFIHGATDAAPGATLELTVEAFGFPTVTQGNPLPDASVEVGWDPESVADAPPTFKTKTDATGRARAVVEVPHGEPGSLVLLVGARHGTHSRTRTVTITRGPASYVELHVADTRVVPTSTISAWARVASTSGKPLANAAVYVSLFEGGVARHRERLVTDRGGLVMARVPIPRIDEPVWQWTLRAELENTRSGAAQIDLSPREESPGTPTLDAHWDVPASGALPGDRLPWAIRLLDATGQPLIEHPLRWWIGPKATNPPATDDEWKKSGTAAKTDATGRVSGTHDAPTLVKTTGTALQLAVQSSAEGHPLHALVHVSIGAPRATLELLPEAGSIVPGLAQRMHVRVRDARGHGVAGRFQLTGDGLSTTAVTDATGEAEVEWNAPPGVGATRNVGPCAGSVAAAVTVKRESSSEEPKSFVQCVAIDREAEGIVRTEPTVARPGDKVRITIQRTRKDRRSFSAVMRAQQRAQSVAIWLEGTPDGSASGELVIPNDVGDGLWTVSAVAPEAGRSANMLSAALLVVPKIAPLLTAKRVGGRATPGGAIEIEGVLSDGSGRGLPGAVSAIVVDAFGGGNADVSRLDTRSVLCAQIRVDSDRCTPTLAADPSTAALRRALLSTRHQTTVEPSNDPGAHAAKETREAFAAVLKSLEGAIFEATKTADTLIDVRRKENGRWVFNPELFTLVTDAMSEPPMTPGGEKLSLSDLSAVDSQVTFDNVARRVTRLKLFRILATVRAERSSKNLDPDEPVFKDPNALLRRLVRSGTLGADALLDPWGGTIQFVRSTTAPIPFLSVVRGFELRAPGPDGLVNTADDVRDPFERVLRSGSPYASAVEEDRLVDAKWDMVVSEETVRAWQQLIEELTGTQLGGLGVSGFGEGGGGHGEGIGLGTIGTIGHGRGSSAISTGDAYWSSPVRTDGEGRVKLTIPLGDVETTWRIALVAVPDGLEPAATTVDVASEAPLSGRVNVGAQWVEGDVVETSVTVRNRTKEAVKATVSTSVEGVAAIDPKAGPITVDVPANGARQVRVRVSAKTAGAAALVVTTRAPGLPEDVLRHAWTVVPAGERRELTQTAWVDGERSLGLTLDHGYSLTDQPRLVLERGYDDAIAAALDSLEPERQTSALALADALDAARRIERWGTQKSAPRSRAIASIASGIGDRARGRYEVFAKLDEKAGHPSGAAAVRMRVDEIIKSNPKAGEAACPPSGEDALDAEPATAPEPLPCWSAYVSSTTQALEGSRDALAIANAVLALADRPHHAALTKRMAERLRFVVGLRPTGEMYSPSLESRAARATVYAALLRAQKLGDSAASQDALFGKIATLRDVTGSYGSSSATLAVVRALLTSQLEGHGTTRARVRVMRPGQGVLDRRIDLPASGFINVALPPGTLDVDVETEGPGVIARLERPVLRSWTRPPPAQASPVAVEVVWPSDARAGSTGVVRVMLRQNTDASAEVDVRIPLPPGVKLAAPTAGVREIQGVLAFRHNVGSGGSVIEAPVRFGLAGKVTVPESIARLTRAASAPATAPARTLVVR